MEQYRRIFVIVMDSLGAGAMAVSSTNPAVWNM